MVECALGQGGTLEFKFLVHVTLISVLGEMRDGIIFLSQLKEVLFFCVSKQFRLNKGVSERTDPRHLVFPSTFPRGFLMKLQPKADTFFFQVSTPGKGQAEERGIGVFVASVVGELRCRERDCRK